MATKSSASGKKSKTAAKKVPTSGAGKAKRKPAAKVKAGPVEVRPKTTSERVKKMRDERTRLGLKRLELYAHPDDWEAIKGLAAELTEARSGVEKK
jgi:hypothetical protein